MTILILLASLIGFTPSAHAMGRGSGPCEPAMDDFCGGLLEFSHESVMKCLKEHESEVGPACQDLLKTWKPSTETQQPGKADPSKTKSKTSDRS
jgi:hypothetical protein